MFVVFTCHIYKDFDPAKDIWNSGTLPIPEVVRHKKGALEDTSDTTI